MTIGLEHVFRATLSGRDDAPTTAREALDRNLQQLGGLADELRHLKTTLDLDDYGMFRVALHAIDDLGLDPDGPLQCVGAALARGSWSSTSRLLALAAVLRLLDYNVAPMVSRDGAVLALPVGDDLKTYNINLLNFKVQRRGRGRPETISYHWALFDGVNPLGEPTQLAEHLLSVQEIVSGPQGTFCMLNRTVPSFVCAHRDPRSVPVHGRDDVLTYNHLPHAHAWLAFYPPLQFEAQARLAMQELQMMDLQPSLESLRSLPESEMVEALLRTVQGHIRYEIGPLRSLFDILDSQHGDCDQMCLLMSTLLRASGFPIESIRSMTWPGHMALAVRPSGDTPPEAVAFEIPGEGTFVALDPAFIQTTGQDNTSQWGKLNQRYARLRFQHKPIE